MLLWPFGLQGGCKESLEHAIWSFFSGIISSDFRTRVSPTKITSSLHLVGQDRNPGVSLMCCVCVGCAVVSDGSRTMVFGFQQIVCVFSGRGGEAPHLCCNWEAQMFSSKIRQMGDYFGGFVVNLKNTVAGSVGPFEQPRLASPHLSRHRSYQWLELRLGSWIRILGSCYMYVLHPPNHDYDIITLEKIIIYIILFIPRSNIRVFLF